MMPLVCESSSQIYQAVYQEFHQQEVYRVVQGTAHKTVERLTMQ